MIQQQSYWTPSVLAPSLDKVPERYRERMTDMFDTWKALLTRNKRLSLYYNMKNQLKDIGISIPDSLLHVNCAMGWVKKAIDAYIVRSTFDGYFIEAAGGGLASLSKRNRLGNLYKMCARSSLIHGLSAITVMAGTGTQPAAKVRAYSANQFSALWDKDEGRIACGVVLADVDQRGNPAKYVAHFPDAVLVLRRVSVAQSATKWDCERIPSGLGRPTMELMPYDADLDRPLGHSMITPELQGIVDKAMRDVLRMDVGAEFFTFPQRYILGAADDLFSVPDDDQQGGYDIVDDEEIDDEEGEGAFLDEEDAEEEAPKRAVSSDYEKFKAYIGAFLAISRDENGEIPTVGQFAASPAENFTHMFENDAQRFSGATNVPLAQLGVLSNTYTSSDALTATNDPLILKVEDMNRDNIEVMEEVARMIMAVADKKHMGKLTDAERNVEAIFSDPAKPTFAARADGWTKLASQDNAIIGTRMYYEKAAGLSQAEITRLEREKLANGAIAQLGKIADTLGAK